MYSETISIKRYGCFIDGWATLDQILPVNVIIGRNNSGKTHFLDIVSHLCGGKLEDTGYIYKFSATLPESLLRQQFPETSSGGVLIGRNHWLDHGRHYVDKRILWETDSKFEPRNVEWGQCNHVGLDEKVRKARTAKIVHIMKSVESPLRHKHLRRLAAERDVRPEPPNVGNNLTVNGAGATDIVRKFLTSSNRNFPRTTITEVMLDALNMIFRPDGNFKAIEIHHHDDPSEARNGTWEIYLNEAHKGSVPLSSSGSGLKTVILVLLNLLVIPKVNNHSPSDYVFAFEELENNLHPALLRRLLNFLEKFVVSEGCKVFLTTHASAALDVFGPSPHAQLIHVWHDGKTADSKRVTAHFDKLDIVSSLGAKPSDLLQANGVIWVEGPSDRIYINRWIDLVSAGELREGRDYTVAYYAGALLAQNQFSGKDSADPALANLLDINRNVAVICDSDISEPGQGRSELKDRVRRVIGELAENSAAFGWVTEAKEIENYLPGSCLAKAFGIDEEKVPDPKRNERFFPSDAMDKKGDSFFEKYLEVIS